MVSLDRSIKFLNGSIFPKSMSCYECLEVLEWTSIANLLHHLDVATSATIRAPPSVASSSSSDHTQDENTKLKNIIVVLYFPIVHIDWPMYQCILWFVVTL